MCIRDRYLRNRNAAQSATKFVYKPCVPLTDLPESQRAEASELVSRVQCCHVKLIDEALHSGFGNFAATLPTGLPENVLQQLKVKWLLDHTYLVIAEVMKPTQEVFIFKPAVSLNEIKNSNKREEYSRLLTRMTARLAEVLSARVDEARARAFQSCALGDMQDIVAQHWMMENYYIIMADVLHSASTHSSEPAPTIAASSHEEHGVPMGLISPKKRARKSTDVTVAPDLVTRSVFECHTSDIGGGDHNRAEMFLLYFAEEPRWLDVKDRKTGLLEKVPVVECLFGDCTGAIQADIWRQSAELYLPRLKEWSQSSNSLTLVGLDRFGVKKEGRRTLQAIRKMIFNENTVLKKTRQTIAIASELPNWARPYCRCPLHQRLQQN